MVGEIVSRKTEEGEVLDPSGSGQEEVAFFVACRLPLKVVVKPWVLALLMGGLTFGRKGSEEEAATEVWLRGCGERRRRRRWRDGEDEEVEVVEEEEGERRARCRELLAFLVLSLLLALVDVGEGRCGDVG